MQFYFLLFCPVSSSCLGLPRLSALSPQLRESARLHMDFFPATWPENGLSAVSWALIGLIFYFSSLIHDSSLWPDFYLTNLFHSNCCPFFFGCFRWRVNLVSITPSWIKIQILCLLILVCMLACIFT